MKNAIRWAYFTLCEVGLASPEVIAESGTLKYRWLCWLYGEDSKFPLFDMQLPEKENQ